MTILLSLFVSQCNLHGDVYMDYKELLWKASKRATDLCNAVDKLVIEDLTIIKAKNSLRNELNKT